MARLADWISPCFPHQSMAMRQELGRRMTADRWNRVAFLLASLHPIPGEGFTAHEHELRSMALAVIPVAQWMAAGTLGVTKYPDECFRSAAHRSSELDRKICNVQ